MSPHIDPFLKMLTDLLTASLLAVLANAAAVKAPAPSYSVNIGKIGPWAHPDDTPAHSYIDPSGQYRFQSSHSGYGYGPTQSRIWSFWVGDNLESVTYDAASYGFDPKNPEDHNQNTTFRCNQLSPTGRDATMPGPGTYYTSANFCDLSGCRGSTRTAGSAQHALVKSASTGSPCATKDGELRYASR